MYVLLLNLCLVAQPSNCHMEQLPFESDMAMTECVERGELEAIEFLRDHPQWALKGWECGLPQT